MSGKSLTLAILALAIVGIAVTVQAQQNYSRDDDRSYSQPKQDRTLLDRLDEFGRNLFGNGEPAQKEPPKKARPRYDAEGRPRYVPSSPDDESRAAAPRAGSVSRAPAREGSSRNYDSSRSNDARNFDYSRSESRSMDYSRSSEGRALDYSLKPSYARSSDADSDGDRNRSSGSRSYRSAVSDREVPVRAPRTPPSSYRTADDNDPRSDEDAPRYSSRGRSRSETTSLSGDSPRPLYERMGAARKSAFGEGASSRPASSPSPVLERSMPDDRPAYESPVPARVVKADPDAAELEPSVPAPIIKRPPALSSVPTSRPESDPTPPATAEVSGSASSSAPLAASREPVKVAEKPVVSSVPVAKPIAESTPPTAVAPPVAPPKADPPPRGDVLLARRSPNLSVETVGPRRIAVGKESKYEITMVNAGDVAAEELLVTVDLPAWAEVAGGEPSVGTTDTVAANAGRQFQWKLLRLDAKSRERLTLRIVPRESKPFDLGVKWTYRELATQAMIEVQEPKLTLSLEGPRDVLFGKKELYRLRVANVGTGDAENVVIKLYPVGSTGQSGAASHNFGTVPAGQDRSIEVELTARQAGTLAVKVEVSCDGGARAELAEKVVVRRATLDLEIAGPKRQYVDAPVAYRVRVVNTGSASAADVVVTATIPAAVKYQSASADGQLESGGRRVRWKIDVLRPGAEKTFELKGTLAQPGAVRLQVDCTSDEVVTTAMAVTEVDAVADLVMDVVDPAGPVAVGQEATYEIRVRNRGSKAADDLELVAFFSQGIEPIAVEGASHKISLGQVAFPKIPSVTAGGEVRLTIRAKAQVAGNHVFRAELQCRPLGTRLASEETTYFYGDDAAPQVLARSSDTGDQRTADRNGDSKTVR
jgi:uncharacterized repeat protein (TIGR01451 family)